MEATALSPTPSRATTLPIPKVSWTTRSPGASDGTSRLLALASASARIAAVPKRRDGGPAVRFGSEGMNGRVHEDCAAPVLRHSTTVARRSARDREGGL